MKDDHTDKELKQIAWDIHAGRIFCDAMIRESDRKNMLQMVFMVLIFMKEDQIKDMENVGMVYEYIDKSMPRSINGYPTFMSCNFLDKDSTKKVMKYHDKIIKFKSEWVDEGPQKELWEKKIDG